MLKKSVVYRFNKKFVEGMFKIPGLSTSWFEKISRGDFWSKELGCSFLLFIVFVLICPRFVEVVVL